MRVVDTSAWIEWICGSTVGESVGRQLLENNEWVVPTIVQYELARSLADSEISEAAAVSAIAFSTQLVVMPLDTDLATKAVD
jgi:predicted nucleic acid-binding protein